MTSSAASARFSWDDFVALGDGDLRELIDGELVEVEVPTGKHEYVVMCIGAALVQWSRAGHGGRAMGSGYKVRVSHRRGVMPDVQFYRAGNDASREQEAGLVEGRPDLAVEVVSPSSRSLDRVKKLQWYAGLGVPEYWIVDPQARTLERLVLRDGLYSIAASHADGDTFRPESFEGLTIPLAELWE